MGVRDFARSLKPGNDRQLAAQLRSEQQAAQQQAAAERAATIRAMSDRDKNRTPAEVADSKERGRRHKRGPFEPPARGVNP
ncbi:hypothetical protein [Streptomyces variegatus]|uniref:hypothetical protein n=1 Tax=Streptomyces variegatus TaxID=284040 RepID=UPI003C2C0F7B